MATRTVFPPSRNRPLGQFQARRTQRAVQWKTALRARPKSLRRALATIGQFPLAWEAWSRHSSAARERHATSSHAARKSLPAFSAARLVSSCQNESISASPERTRMTYVCHTMPRLGVVNTPRRSPCHPTLAGTRHKARVSGIVCASCFFSDLGHSCCGFQGGNPLASPTATGPPFAAAVGAIVRSTADVWWPVGGSRPDRAFRVDPA